MRIIFLTTFCLFTIVVFSQKKVQLNSIELNTSFNGYTVNSGKTSYRSLHWLGLNNDYLFSQIDTTEYNIIAIGNRREQFGLLPSIFLRNLPSNYMSTIELNSNWKTRKEKITFDLSLQLLGLSDWFLGLSHKVTDYLLMEKGMLISSGFVRKDVQLSLNTMCNYKLWQNKYFNLEISAGPALALTTSAYWEGGSSIFDTIEIFGNNLYGITIRDDGFRTRRVHSRRTKVIDLRTKIAAVFFKNRKWNLAVSFNNSFGVLGFGRLIHLDYNNWVYKRYNTIGIRRNFGATKKKSKN